MTPKDTSGSHGSRPSREGWLVDSAYKALESLEESIWGEGGGPSNATLYHLNCLRGTLQLLQESPGSSTRVPECEETEISTGSFCQVATSTMRQLGKEALVQGLDQGLETDARGVTAADGEHRGRRGHGDDPPVMNPWM